MVSGIGGTVDAIAASWANPAPQRSTEWREIAKTGIR
jgi:hypothetical protein